MVLFDETQAADAGTDGDANPLRVLFGDGQAGIVQGLHARRHAITG